MEINFILKKKKKWGLRLKQPLERQRKKSEEKIVIWTHYRENVEISKKGKSSKTQTLNYEVLLKDIEKD